MPASSWKYNIGAILEILRRRSPGPLEREEIETLFHVSRRGAHQLMHTFGGKTPAGRGWGMTVDRDELIARLEERERSGETALLEDRRAYLDQKLDGLRQERATPFADFRIPPGRAAYGCRFENLPAGIHFEPGRIAIDYSDLPDLFTKLFLLAQAAINDLDQLAEAVEKPKSQALAV